MTYSAEERAAILAKMRAASNLFYSAAANAGCHAFIEFTGTTPGRYTFECSRLCGAGHNFMRGVLIVRPPGAAR